MSVIDSTKITTHLVLEQAHKGGQQILDGLVLAEHGRQLHGHTSEGDAHILGSAQQHEPQGTYSAIEMSYVSVHSAEMRGTIWVTMMSARSAGGRGAATSGRRFVA